MRTAPRRAGERSGTDFALAAVLLFATLAVYAPVCGYGFVNFDDPGYLSQNPHVQRGLDRASVAWALTTTHRANWSPVTWLSYLLDVELFGVDPAAHHGVNLLLHAVNVTLLFALLVRLGGARAPSFVVAALFAVHPLRVESVAWISERKDVLCALFALLALHAWAGFTRRGGVARYAAALLLFALGLMAKPMLVTLPFVLLLLDFWPLCRTRWSPPAAGPARVRPLGRLVLEKLPFLALSCAASVVTLVAQRAAGAVTDSTALPLATRAAGTLAAYGWYVGKTVWPSGLAVLYPNRALVGESAPAWQILAGGIVIALVSVLALRDARRRPWLLVGWATFVGMLVPVIGLVQVGQQSTADRYTYLPSIGLFVVLVGALAEASRRMRVPLVLRIAGVAVLLVVLGVATRLQLAYWRDSVTLASRALAVTDGNYVMHFNLALAVDEQGDLPAAIRNYEAAVRLRPDLASFRGNLAAALVRAGRVDEAVAQYQAAIVLDPRDPAAANNLAWLRATHPSAEHRDGAAALELADSVLRLRPGDSDALDLMAAAQAEIGHFAEAERTAAAAQAAAVSAGRDDLTGALAERRALYRERRPYREDPAAAAAGVSPSIGEPSDITLRSPALPAGAPPPPAPLPATVP